MTQTLAGPGDKYPQRAHYAPLAWLTAPCQPCIKCWYSRTRQVQLSGQPGKCQNALKYHEVP